MKTLTLTTDDIVRLYYTIPVSNRIAERPEGWLPHLEILKTYELVPFLTALQWLLDNNYYICLPAMPDWFLKKHNLRLDDFTGAKLHLDELEFDINDHTKIIRNLRIIMNCPEKIADFGCKLQISESNGVITVKGERT